MVRAEVTKDFFFLMSLLGKIKGWPLYNVIIIVILLIQEIEKFGIHHSTVIQLPLNIEIVHVVMVCKYF